jgi:antitoxin MazE
MQSALRKIGNSTGIVLPRPILGTMGVASGTMLDLTVEDGRLIATPIRREVRAGWAEAAKRISAETNPDDDWIEAAPDDSSDWTW